MKTILAAYSGVLKGTYIKFHPFLFVCFIHFKVSMSPCPAVLHNR